MIEFEIKTLDLKKLDRKIRKLYKKRSELLTKSRINSSDIDNNEKLNLISNEINSLELEELNLLKKYFE
jgi:hypothetical protein